MSEDEIGHKISRIDYERTTEKIWIGKKVQTSHEIQNREIIIPKGTICTITRKYKGFSLVTEPCKTCGVKIIITRVPYYDLAIIKEQGFLIDRRNKMLKEKGGDQEVKVLDNKEIYKKAIEKWGVGAQLLMLFEEMSELQFAVCKYMRNMDEATINKRKLDILDEIADVYIMLGQLLTITGFHEMDLEHKVLVKISRLESRLKEGEPRP